RDARHGGAAGRGGGTPVVASPAGAGGCLGARGLRQGEFAPDGLAAARGASAAPAGGDRGHDGDAAAGLVPRFAAATARLIVRPVEDCYDVAQVDAWQEWLSA